MRLSGNERKYVEEVLNHEFRSSKSGFMVSRLEEAFANHFAVRHAIALCNGTATLHSILSALGCSAGDEIIVPALTMASTSLCCLHAGCTPVFADVCKDSWCIDPESIKRLINERTRAIITVALYGMPPDMDRILEAAQGIPVIEDDAQCVGGYYKGRLAGTIGRAASFSFQSSKTLTAGEGGIVVTSDSDLAGRIRQFSNLGYPANATREYIQHPDAIRHVQLGWNYRMADLQAAVCLGQLEDLELHVKQRQDAARNITVGATWVIEQSAFYDHVHSCWAKAYRLENAPGTWEQFVTLFSKHPYACWLPNYKEPVFQKWLRDRNLPDPVCPVAEEIQPKIVAFQTNV